MLLSLDDSILLKNAARGWGVVMSSGN